MGTLVAFTVTVQPPTQPNKRRLVLADERLMRRRGVTNEEPGAEYAGNVLRSLHALNGTVKTLLGNNT